MPTPETSLETSSNISLEEMGLVLATGAVCVSAFQFFKGIYKLYIGGTQAVRRNGLRSGGIVAVWVGLSHVMQCSIDHVRQKEDPWNYIFSTATAAGFLQMRKGLGPASRWSLFGGVVGALYVICPYLIWNRHSLPPSSHGFGGGEKEEEEKKSGDKCVLCTYSGL